MASLPSAASPTLEGKGFTRGARRVADGSVRSTTMDNPRTRQAVAAVFALIGGFLLYMSAGSESDFATSLTSFWVELILFVVVAWLRLRWYRHGTDIPSDEVDIREWWYFRFLRDGHVAAPLYLGIRLSLA